MAYQTMPWFSGASSTKGDDYWQLLYKIIHQTARKGDAIAIHVKTAETRGPGYELIYDFVRSSEVSYFRAELRQW